VQTTAENACANRPPANARPRLRGVRAFARTSRGAFRIPVCWLAEYGSASAARVGHSTAVVPSIVAAHSRDASLTGSIPGGAADQNVRAWPRAIVNRDGRRCAAPAFGRRCASDRLAAKSCVADDRRRAEGGVAGAHDGGSARRLEPVPWPNRVRTSSGAAVAGPPAGHVTAQHAVGIDAADPCDGVANVASPRRRAQAGRT